MTQYYNFQKKVDQKELKQCANMIEQGKLVIFPTETVYGIGANALCQQATKNIFIAKGRARRQSTNCTYCNKRANPRNCLY